MATIAPAAARAQKEATHAFFEDLFVLARTGKTDKRGGPGFLRMLVLARRHDVRLATVPLPLQRALAALLAPIAHLLRLDARPAEDAAPPARPPGETSSTGRPVRA